MEDYNQKFRDAWFTDLTDLTDDFEWLLERGGNRNLPEEDYEKACAMLKALRTSTGCSKIYWSTLMGFSYQSVVGAENGHFKLSANYVEQAIRVFEDLKRDA